MWLEQCYAVHIKYLKPLTWNLWIKKELSNGAMKKSYKACTIVSIISIFTTTDDMKNQQQPLKLSLGLTMQNSQIRFSLSCSFQGKKDFRFNDRTYNFRL